MGKYLDKVRRAEQNGPGLTKGLGSAGSVSIRPGAVMTWEGPDGKRRGPAVVDFVHTDQDGSCWLFVTLLDGGWAAVNSRYAQKIDEGQNRPSDTQAK